MATVTVKQTGGDYSTLAAAMSARTADGDTISIEGSWTVNDTAVCTNSYNTTVTTDASSANPGYVPASPSHYRLRPTSGNCITLGASLTITGVEIGSQSTTTSDEIFRVNADSISLTSKKCLLYFASRNAEQDVVYTNAFDNLTIDFENCGFWNVQRGVVDAFNSIGTNTYNFNSCHGYEIGYSSTAGARSGLFGSTNGAGTHNVAVFNSAIHINTGYVFSGGSTCTDNVTCDRSITNVSDWTDANIDSETITDSTLSETWTDGTPSAGNVAVNDITTAPFDLRLQDDSNNGAQDAHADSTGAGLTMPSDDIVGTSRPQNTNYDIGYFEVVAAGGGGALPAGSLSLIGVGR